VANEQRNRLVDKQIRDLLTTTANGAALIRCRGFESRPPNLKRPFRGFAGRPNQSQLPSSAHNSECVTRVPSKRNSCAGRRRGSMVVSACTMAPPPEGMPSPVAAPSSK
jgi:hypothetical protein